MNPNQDLIDLINLNKIRDLNDDSLISEDEKTINAKAIEREQRTRMNKLRLTLTPEQMKQVRKQEDEILRKCIDDD